MLQSNMNGAGKQYNEKGKQVNKNFRAKKRIYETKRLEKWKKTE